MILFTMPWNIWAAASAAARCGGRRVVGWPAGQQNPTFAP